MIARVEIWELDETWEPFKSIFVSELVALGFSDDDSERIAEVVVAETRIFYAMISEGAIEDRVLENSLRGFMKDEYVRQVVKNRCFLGPKP